MKFFEITYMLKEEPYERLSALGERYEKVIGVHWSYNAWPV